MPPIKPNVSRPSANGKTSLAARIKQHRAETAASNDSDQPYLSQEEGDVSGLTATWEDLAVAVGNVRWLVKGWVPYGMLTGIIGESKCGKSAFALHGIIRPVVTGCDWFNGGKSGEPGRVLYCDTERSGIINAERMKAWDVPLDRVLTPFKDFYRVLDIVDKTHLAHLKNVVRQGGIKLVLVDSLRGSHRGPENDSQLANAMLDLGQIALETGVAVVIIHHTRKPAVEQVEIGKHDGRGSGAILASLRHQIAIDMPLGHDHPWRRVQVLGSNLGHEPQPFGYKIGDSGLEYGAAPRLQPRQTKRGDIAEWLLSYMTRGAEYSAKEVTEAGEAAGFDERTIRATIKSLGIVPVQKREGNRIVGWYWTLPV